jgi:multidrug transporter EmrE-like cation transporter
MVEVLGSAAHSLKVFTDENGFYSASGLLPGVYSVKAYSPSFLPALREKIGLQPGSSVLVNLKLSGLFESIQLPALRGPADDDDWKWVLRSASNRPILRMLGDGTLVPVAAAEAGGSEAGGDRPALDKHDLRGTLSFVAGSASGGFGSSSDVNTGFSVERSLFSSGTVALQGNVGYNGGSPNTVLRASYSHALPNGSKPEMAFTMRRLAAPGINGHDTALQALAQGILAGPAALYLFAFSIQTIGVARAAVFPATVPALTILAGWLILGEQPTALQAAGLVTVLFGFYLAQRQRA